MCSARGLFFVVENPMNSLIYLFMPMAAALVATRAVRQVFWLGDFGASSRKPVELWSNHPWLFRRLRQRMLCNRQVNRLLAELDMEQAPPKPLATRHNGWVTGTRHLRDSAIYPTDFVRNVAHNHSMFLHLCASCRVGIAQLVRMHLRSTSTIQLLLREMVDVW